MTDLPTSAQLRPRDLRPPADLDAQLARYRALAEIVEARLEDVLVLTDDGTVRQTDDGHVAGEILLPRSVGTDRAWEVGEDLLRLVGAVDRFDLSQDATGRLRLVVTWDPFPTEETAR